jgi:hypothetical protein
MDFNPVSTRRLISVSNPTSKSSMMMPISASSSPITGGVFSRTANLVNKRAESKTINNNKKIIMDCH